MINIQKCSGKGCTLKTECLHYSESLLDTRVKGKWVDAEQCISSGYGFILRVDDKPPAVENSKGQSWV